MEPSAHAPGKPGLLAMVCARPAAGQQAVRAAALGHLLAASTRILGVDFYTPGAPEGEATVKRMEAALAMGKKLCNRLLPVDIRRDLWRTRIVPKAAWGHLFRGISEGRVKQFRALGPFITR